MSSEWPLVLIDDIKAPYQTSIAIGPFGSRMKSDCYVADGVKVVRGTNISSGRSLAGDFVYITPEKSRELGSANLKPHDLVFPHRGAIGEIGIVPDDGSSYVISSSLMKLSCDESKANPLFVYYFFKSERGRFELLKNASQVGTPGIGQPLSSLKSIRIPLPKLGEQKKISDLLGALDDRITLLRETNTTLEAIAQALFKSWFVDFDPVRAKAEGRAPEGMDAATAALFPDSFEESELGLVPRGWRVIQLGDVLDVIETGRRPKGGVASFTEGVPSVGAESINGIGNFEMGKTKYVPHEFYEKMKSGHVENLDVLLYKDGGKPGDFRPRVSMFGNGFPFEIFVINEHVFRLRSKALRQEYLYFFIGHDSTLSELRNRGAKAAIPGINQNDVKTLKIVLPSGGVVGSFSSFAGPLLEKILANASTAQTLTQLRDTLLPRLISGQLRLPEAEARIEAALA